MSKSKISLQKLPGILYGLIAVCLAFSMLAKGFFSVYNFLNIAKDCCLLITVSLGMSICILSGYLNISVGALMSLCGIITALCLHAGMNMFLSILMGLAAGCFMGALSGLLIAYVQFDFWVVTYAFMGISQGSSLMLSNGNTVPGFAKSFRFIGDGKILGIYCMIWITALICIIMVFLSFKTKFGYNIYSIGGSYQSTALSGVNVKKNIFFVFLVSGLLAAISGIMLASKSNSASPIGGMGYEFDAIAAVLIGGTSFDGGKGKITGTIIGAILMRVLRNGLNLLGLSPYLQTFIIGLIVMVIILMDVLNQNRKETKALRRVYK